MASEVPREKEVGIFKPTATDRLAAKRAKPRDKRAARPGNSEEHLEALRQCPCVVTLRVPAGEVHHLKYGTGERGAGMRSSDRWGLPITRGPHDEIERAGSRNETAVLAGMGVKNPLDLAAALWGASPDVKRMTKVIYAWRGVAPKRGE